MLAVATPREESLVGIYQRFEQQHEQGTENPRFVPEKYHDDTIRGFENTLAKAASIDRVRVIDRTGQVLFDSHVQHNKQANAIEALAAGRKLTDTKLADITKTWAAVESAAKQRNAPGSYLDAVSGHTQRLEDMQKERIHAHTMKKLDTNAATLGTTIIEVAQIPLEP
jgi:UDP-N-acetylglucosamine kinase